MESFGSFLLTELFNSKVPPRRIHKDDVSPDRIDVITQFELSDGRSMRFYFGGRREVYGDNELAASIDFAIEGRFDRAETRDSKFAMEVFSIVLSEADYWIKKCPVQPDIITFSADKDDTGGSRGKLYDRLVRKYAGRYGYSVRVDRKSSKTYYELYL